MVREVVQENQKVEGLLKRHLGAGAQISSIAHSLGEDAHNLQHLQSLPQRSAVHPEFLASSRSGGNLPPGLTAPVDISRLIFSRILAVSRVSAGGLRRVPAVGISATERKGEELNMP